MMAANYRHIGGGENRLGRHYSRFSGIWPTSFLADQSLTPRKSQNAGSNRPSRARGKRPAPEVGGFYRAAGGRRSARRKRTGARAVATHDTTSSLFQLR